MKFARGKQRGKSARQAQPALHGAAPTCESQTQTWFPEEHNVPILKAILNIIIHNF